MVLAGKVALVTGAGRGLGEAHAYALAAAGARVMVNDYGGSATGSGEGAQEPARHVAEAIAAAGGTAIADGTDISSWDASTTLVERTVAEFGRLDILVANAGVCRPTAFGKTTEEDWSRLMDVNAKGMTALIEAAARHWQQRGPEAGRAIVCTASPAGTYPHPPLGIYGVTKAAVLALMQVAAQELAPLGVRANALAPVARTRMMHVAMAGARSNIDAIMPADPDYDLYLPEHVARLVLWLVSPLCNFTGRLFGVRADDIFLFDGWDASQHLDNSGQAWTLERLAAAFAPIARQTQAHIIGPKGRHPVPFPSDAILELVGHTDRP